MSKIEVNTVEPQCGTTLTLGGSGDTVALGSGASQTGFGRTGTVDWITTPKVTGDSPVTGVSGKGYFLNTTAGEITINLPAGSAGDIISMADYAETWDTYKVTVSANGSEKIGGVAENANLNTKGQSVTFVYVDTVQGWLNTMDSTSNVRGTPPYPVATVSGSCNTLTTADCGNYKIATFKNPGTLCVSSVSSCATNDRLDYMIAAAGGGGGRDNGGGGGAGGLRFADNTYTNPAPSSPRSGASSVTATVQAYSITVGSGGAGAPPGTCGGTRGGPSTALGITSTGGGGGGYDGGDAPPTYGPGGSGGGGGQGANGKPGNEPPVAPSQGEPGGNTAGNPSGGGGGGGFLNAGSQNSGDTGGAGGAGGGFPETGVGTAAGQACGSNKFFSGGGGGGNGQPGGGSGGAGGLGGGGAGSTSSPGSPTQGTAGTAYTGGGGGAGGQAGDGANGGAGVVIIRYRFQ